MSPIAQQREGGGLAFDTGSSAHAQPSMADKLKAKLANLQANSKAVGDVNDKITSATSARSVTSGAIFIQQCGLLLILIGQDPSNFGILAMGEMIVAFDGTFTDAELETLVAVGEDMADALVAIDAEAAAVLATYLGKFQTIFITLQCLVSTCS
jgi:hypothetical protein